MRTTFKFMGLVVMATSVAIVPIELTHAASSGEEIIKARVA